MTAVIPALKIKPRRCEVTTIQDDDKGEQSYLYLTYSFKGKLSGLGTFLTRIANDIQAAGGYVASIAIPSLRPANEDPGDLKPDGPWQELSVRCWVKSICVVEADRKAWAEAIRDIATRL